MVLRKNEERMGLFKRDEGLAGSPSRDPFVNKRADQGLVFSEERFRSPEPANNESRTPSPGERGKSKLLARLGYDKNKPTGPTGPTVYQADDAYGGVPQDLAFGVPKPKKDPPKKL